MWQKLQALLGLGSVGAIAGSVVMPIYAWLVNLGLGGLVTAGDMVAWVVLGAGGGALLSIGFGSLLGLFERQKTVDELGQRRIGLLGALAGAALPISFLLITSGTLHFTIDPMAVAKVTGMWAALGGAMSTTMVALAKRAHREELAVVEEIRALSEETTPAT